VAVGVIGLVGAGAAIGYASGALANAAAGALVAAI